jgi:DNA primase
MEAQLAASLDVFERKVQILERAGWFTELQKKRRALDRLLPTIRATSDEIMRDLYVGRASEITGVDRAILLRELGMMRPQAAERATEPQEDQATAVRSTAGDRRGPRRKSGSAAERELVRAMLQHRSRVETIAERIGPDSFHDAHYRAIFAALLDSGEDAGLEQLSEILDPDALAIAEDLSGDTEAIVDPQRTIDDSMAQLEARRVEQRLAEIDRLLPLAAAEEKDRLSSEKLLLVRQVRSSGKMRFKRFRGGRSR